MVEYAATRFANVEYGLTYSPENVVIDGEKVYDKRDPERRHMMDFGEFCAIARRDRIDLGARGFFATPGVDYNRETGRGNPFY